jgi:hypothetical protein
VSLERGPLSLVSTNEELLERKSSDSCLENREYGHRDRADHATPSIRESWPLTSTTSSGRSVCIVRSRTKATEIFQLFSLTIDTRGIDT